MKICVFKKWIQHLGVFNFKSLLLAKICVYIPNITFSNVKLSYLNQERNLHRSNPVYKQKQWEDYRGWTFSLWIKDSYFGQNQWFAFNVLMMDLIVTNTSVSLNKVLIDGLEWCGLLVDYCDVFNSCLDSHSDGTHSLQRIHCWASGVMLSPNPLWWRKNSSTSWMTWGQVHSQLIFIFGLTIPLKNWTLL